MYTITEEIIVALERVKSMQPDPTNRVLGERVGLSEGAIGRILNGKCKQVRSGTWEKMHKLIAPFLSTSDVARAMPSARSARVYASSALDIPAELEREIESIASELCIPSEAIALGLVKAFVRDYKAGKVRYWPPKFSEELV